MTRFPGGHFERQLARSRKIFHIRAFCYDRYRQPLGLTDHQPLVGVTASSTELVIEMRNRDSPFVFFGKRVKNMKQHHGIDTAGNRHQDFLPSPQKSARANGLVKLLRQVVHAEMLTQYETGAR